MRSLSGFAAAFSVVLFLGVSVLAAPSQEEPAPIPREQALKMGAGKFMKKYSELRKDFSTAGTVEASAAYQKIKEADNNVRLARLSAAQRQQVVEIDRVLVTFGKTEYLYACMRSGGGTIYTTFAAYNTASRADFFGKLIQILAQGSKKNAGLRSKATRTLAQVEKRLASMQHPSMIDETSVADTLKAQYPKQYTEAVAAMRRIKPILAALPDDAAVLLADRLMYDLTYADLN